MESKVIVELHTSHVGQLKTVFRKGKIIAVFTHEPAGKVFCSLQPHADEARG